MRVGVAWGCQCGGSAGTLTADETEELESKIHARGGGFAYLHPNGSRVDAGQPIHEAAAEKEKKGDEAKDVFVHLVEPGKGHIDELGHEEGEASGEAAEAGPESGARALDGFDINVGFGKLNDDGMRERGLGRWGNGGRGGDGGNAVGGVGRGGGGLRNGRRGRRGSGGSGFGHELGQLVREDAFGFGELAGGVIVEGAGGQWRGNDDGFGGGQVGIGDEGAEFIVGHEGEAWGGGRGGCGNAAGGAWRAGRQVIRMGKFFVCRNEVTRGESCFAAEEGFDFFLQELGTVFGERWEIGGVGGRILRGGARECRSREVILHERVEKVSAARGRRGGFLVEGAHHQEIG